ncbi:hypothetical protein CKM354_000916500 [Cercospora kikuchii]|uniref:Uncharacterized protein n=1 Tax=Cercospora kikuchii TaxID=84275 RepID=A0A9P3FJ04_9PEZI|nr:uncharacterized protein CKM354_000916500 [Cercospora kikuchii]GIZ46022.1 hypothetical protein CKM354_000916500 [Cercospora kikuchii]
MTRNRDQALGLDMLDYNEQALIDQVCAEWGVNGVVALWDRFDGEPQPFMGTLVHDKGLASVLAEGAVYSLGDGYFQPMDQEALIQAAKETISQNLARVSESPTQTIWLIRASTACKGKVTFGTKPSLYERSINGEATFGTRPSLYERSVNGKATFGIKPSLHEQDLEEKRGRLEEKIRKDEKRLRKVEKKLRKEERAGRGDGATLAQVNSNEDEYLSRSQKQSRHQASFSDQASSSDQDEAAWRNKVKSSPTMAQPTDTEDEDEAEASSHSKAIVRKKSRETKVKVPAGEDKDADEDEFDDKGVVSAHKKKSHRKGHRTLEQIPSVTDQDIEDLLDFKVAD